MTPAEIEDRIAQVRAEVRRREAELSDLLDAHMHALRRPIEVDQRRRSPDGRTDQSARPKLSTTGGTVNIPTWLDEPVTTTPLSDWDDTRHAAALEAFAAADDAQRSAMLAHVAVFDPATLLAAAAWAGVR